MATISLNLSGSLARISNSFTASAKTATGHGSTIQAEASCSVSYNSTSKTYTVQTVYLKIKWPEDKNSDYYALEVNYLKIDFIINQVD